MKQTTFVSFLGFFYFSFPESSIFTFHETSKIHECLIKDGREVSEKCKRERFSTKGGMPGLLLTKNLLWQS